MSRSRVSYTGHARGGTFQGLNLTRAGIEANKRKAADDLQILREQSIQREAVEKENLRQMQAAFSAEQTQAAENRQFEQGLESNRMEFLRRNQRTEEKAGAQRVQNILLESQDKAKDLSVFSKGAMQLFETGQKMYTEHQETAELISGVLGDTNFEDLRNEHLAEAELNILSTRRQNMLALMLESGIARDDPRFVAEEARKDRSTDFKLVKEHVTTLGAKYSGWMQQKLGELGLVDPGQISRAKGILAYQFLVEHNLVNEKGGVINKSILRPLFQSMEAAYNSEIKQASFAELRVALDDNANKKLTLYYKDQSEENLAHVLAAFRTKLGKDGEPLGQGATSHFFRTVLTNTLEITDTELEQFLDSKVPESWAQKPGQTFRDRYQKDGINSPLLQEVMEGRKEDIAARNRRDKGVESAVHAGKLKAAMDWVQGINPDDMWDKDIDDLKLVISELKKEGIDTNTLEQYLLNSNESQNAAWWTEYLKGLETKGVLTQDDLKDTNIPITVRREFAKSAKTLSDQLQEAGVGKLSDLDKDWEDYLKIQMKAENAFSVTDGSLREGVREAGRQYAAKFKRYAKTLPIFDAHRKAYTEIQSDLENGVGKFKVENNRATGVAELPAFKSKAYLNSTKYNPDDLDDIALRISKDPALLKNELLFPTATMQNIVEQIRSGGFIDIPGSLKDIARVTGSKYGSQSELLNNQLELFDKANDGKYPERIGVTIIDKLGEETTDESTKRLILKIRTHDDAANAVKIILAEKGKIDEKTLMPDNINKTTVDDIDEEFYEFPVGDNLEPDTNGVANLDYKDLTTWTPDSTLGPNYEVNPIYYEIDVDGGHTVGNKNGSLVRVNRDD